jgi:sulfur relay (sulfurtransferase) DsrC/TusE family protein
MTRSNITITDSLFSSLSFLRTFFRKVYIFNVTLEFSMLVYMLSQNSECGLGDSVCVQGLFVTGEGQNFGYYFLI